MGNTWNLIWEPYQGFVVSSYNIYRGTTPNQLQLIGTISGVNTQFTDLTPSAGYLYYQVEVVAPYACNPYVGLQPDEQFFIFNAQGQLVKIGSGLKDIDLTPLSNGVNFIQFEHYNQKIRLKFLLQR